MSDGEIDDTEDESPDEQDDGSLDLDTPSSDERRSVASDGFSAACLADPTQANCCSAGQVVLTGTSSDDFWSFSSTASTARCVLGNGGHDDAYLSAGGDTVLFGSGDDYVTAREGQNRLLGGAGDDILKSGSGADTLYGGDGLDDLYAGGGADWVDGGAGDDHIQGQDGNDVIFPGEGKDYVLAGNGNDTIVLRSTCELEVDEYLSGGSGTDTLYAPLDAAGLAGLGVDLWSIEQVVLIPPQPAACDACETTADCLGPKSECVATGAGFATCQCPNNFQGEGCDACAPGYEGDTCETCAAGYVDLYTDHEEINEVVDGASEEVVPERRRGLPLTCVPEADVIGPSCSQASGDGGLVCGPRGTCVEDEGIARCQCDEGAAGANCELCVPGFEVDANGDCAPASDCDELICSGRGTCVLEDGDLTCDCEPGLTQPDCGDLRLRVTGAEDSVVVGVEGIQDVRLLAVVDGDGRPPSGTCTWAPLTTNLGTLHSCTEAAQAGVTTATPCTSSCEAVYVPPSDLPGDEVILFDGVEVTPTAGGPTFLARIPVTKVVPMAGSIRPELGALYGGIIRFMRARGVRAASFALRRGDAPSETMLRLTEVGFGWRDAGLTCSNNNPFQLQFCPPPGDEKAWRVRPQTPFRLASMTKPLIAAAAKARWADLAGTTDVTTGYTYSLTEPNVLSLLERPDILPFSAPYFGDLVDFAYNRVDPAVRDPRFADVTLDHLLRHRAGFCRQKNIPGLRYSPTTQPGGIGVLPPEPDEPPVQPNRSPLAQLGTGFTVRLVGAVNLSVAAGSGVTQGTLPFGAAALELNRARLVVLNDLLMACFETAGNDPLERQACIDEAVWDHRAIYRFVMGTTLVFDPGATNAELGAAMGTPDQENRCAENYGNVGHLLIGHLIAASYGDTYFSDPGDAPTLWGPSARRPLEYLRTFLTAPNPAPAELFAIDASLPTGQNAESWREPFYRGLDPTTGDPRRDSVVFANPAFFRWNDGSSQWEFCRTMDEASCLATRDTFPAHPDWSTTHAPAMRAYVHDVGYGGAAGFAATARAYSALANRHIAASGNENRVASGLPTWGQAAGQRWTSTPNLPAPKTFGHGGAFAGTATSTNNVLAGARLAVTTPSFDPATSPTWDLNGPILSPPQNAVGEVTTTTFPASCPSLPFVIPGLPPPPACNTCTIAEDLQWVLLMNQGDDPTAIDGTSYDRRNDLVRDALCRLETSGTWPAPLSPAGLDQLGGTP